MADSLPVPHAENTLRFVAILLVGASFGAASCARPGELRVKAESENACLERVFHSFREAVVANDRTEVSRLTDGRGRFALAHLAYELTGPHPGIEARVDEAASLNGYLFVRFLLAAAFGATAEELDPFVVLPVGRTAADALVAAGLAEAGGLIDEPIVAPKRVNTSGGDAGVTALSDAGLLAVRLDELSSRYEAVNARRQARLRGRFTGSCEVTSRRRLEITRARLDNVVAASSRANSWLRAVDGLVLVELACGEEPVFFVHTIYAKATKAGDRCPILGEIFVPRARRVDVSGALP